MYCIQTLTIYNVQTLIFLINKHHNILWLVLWLYLYSVPHFSFFRCLFLHFLSWRALGLWLLWFISDCFWDLSLSLPSSLLASHSSSLLSNQFSLHPPRSIWGVIMKGFNPLMFNRFWTPNTFPPSCSHHQHPPNTQINTHTYLTVDHSTDVQWKTLDSI